MAPRILDQGNRGVSFQDLESIWEFPLPDGLVLVRADSPGFFILNSTATYIWRLLQSGQSDPDAARDLAARFDVPVETALGDIERVRLGCERTLFGLPPLPVPAEHRSYPAQLPNDAFSSTYRLHGRNIRVILSGSELLHEILPRLEGLPVPPAADPDATLLATVWGDRYQIFRDSAWLATEDHSPDARVMFLEELVRAGRPNQEWTAILHAGACGSQSNCVVFPGSTHSGKTTLAAVLMHAGMTVFADDSVALERGTLNIPAMPFSLMIREGSWPAVSARFPQLESLPVHDRYGQNVKFLPQVHPAEDAVAQATAIVFARWDPDAETSIVSLDSLETLVRLKESGFWVAHDRENIQVFLDWLKSLPIYEVVYSNIDEAANFIKPLVNVVEACESPTA